MAAANVGCAISKIAGVVATRIAEFSPVVAVGIGLTAGAIWTIALVWLAIDGVWAATVSLANAL
jgi:hypothetical protein